MEKYKQAQLQKGIRIKCHSLYYFWRTIPIVEEIYHKGPAPSLYYDWLVPIAKLFFLIGGFLQHIDKTGSFVNFSKISGYCSMRLIYNLVENSLGFFLQAT